MIMHANLSVVMTGSCNNFANPRKYKGLVRSIRPFNQIGNGQQ